MTVDGSTVYCTVVAQNYLPQALALHVSIQEHSPDIELVVMVVDGDRQDLKNETANLRIVGLDFLGLARREVLDLAAIYDVVEFSTSIKPLFFLQLLNKYEQVVYLDPDTYLITSLDELAGIIDKHGTVFTPHFLRPIEPGTELVSEVHSLTVGVHNLGFCAFNRTSRPFLNWWWSHLRRECLIYPLLSIFVDQKWTDIGSVLFGAHSWRHAGYNVGPWNLHEREIIMREGGLFISATGHPLRLVHFSGFDPLDPDAISVRLSISLKDAGGVNEEFRALSRKYADSVLKARERLGTLPEYGYGRDTTGRALSKRLRKTYRSELLDDDGVNLPSPFLVSDRKDYEEWRRRAFIRSVKITFADIALAAKYALPDEFQFVKKRLPRLAGSLRGKLLESSKVRR